MGFGDQRKEESRLSDNRTIKREYFEESKRPTVTASDSDYVRKTTVKTWMKNSHMTIKTTVWILQATNYRYSTREDLVKA